jgi:hypothetical protein
MKPAPKDSRNPHYKQKYADLTSIWESAREPLTKNGLSVMQEPTNDDHYVSIKTFIFHTSGEWIEFDPLKIPMKNKDAHSVGAAITYGKRYAFCSSLGITTGEEDDDGNSNSILNYKHEPSHEQDEHADYTDAQSIAALKSLGLGNDVPDILEWLKQRSNEKKMSLKYQINALSNGFREKGLAEFKEWKAQK